MSVSGEFEGGDSGNSANFWDIKQYSRVVKRVENAYKLSSELCSLIHERAEIEKSYATSLSKWSSKWQGFLDSGIEYGTTQATWRGCCTEASKLSTLHLEMRTQLEEDVASQIKHWQKENFHKSALPPQSLKESKSLEVEFENSQKPWAKRYKRVQQCRKDYHNACKMVKSYNSQIATTDQNSDQNPTPESFKQQKKLQDKLKKAEKDVDKTKGAYEGSLKDLETENPRYIEDMTDVFKKSQTNENARLDFFKQIFYGIHKALDVSNKPELPEIYSEFNTTIGQLNSSDDLRWWSENYGADMPVHFPVFEEYSPDAHALSKKRGGGDPATLTTYNETNSRQSSFRGGGTVGSTDPAFSNQQSAGGHNGANSTGTPESVTPGSASQLAVTQRQISYDETLNPFSQPTPSAVNGVPTTTPVHQTPFSEEPLDSDNYYDNLTDDGKPGIKVRALYDYAGAEEDEISFKAGDIFEKLEDEDEQGWCKGRKDSRVGLYPANYVEPV